MDQFDRAQALEATERNAILEAKRGEAERQSRFSLSHCEDCGDEIDQRRLKSIKGVKRCITCQEDYEKQKKRGLR